jgi:ribosomal protein S18 acetylase RimI-like enzyme
MLQLERLQARAWPAAECVEWDGWNLRFNAGYTGRANSINPYEAGTLPAREKIEECERIYAERGLPPVFRLAPWARPQSLPRALAQARYARQRSVHVMVRPLQSFDFTPASGVSVESGLSEDWLRLYGQVAGNGSEHSPGDMGRVLRRVEPELLCAVVQQDGAPVAAGLGVVDELHLGLFCIHTHPEHRRCGHARSLCRTLLAEGLARAATSAYLQVRRENESALALYEGMGFSTAYDYCYWTQQAHTA